MKAAIFRGPKSIRIEEIDRPKAEPDSVIIAMKNCGICGSDLHAYFGVWQQPAAPSGHEASGVIVECGTSVAGFGVGDRVCMEWFAPCGHCRFCRAGDYNLCDDLRCTAGTGPAGFAEYIAAHQSSLFRVPPVLTFEEAAMVEPLAVACRTVHRSSAGFADDVLVFGCGTIGLLTVAVCRVSGVRSITAMARYEHQAALAEEMGAHRVHLVGSTGGGGTTAAEGASADVVVETTASPGGVTSAVNSVRKGGTLVLVGGFHAPVEVNLREVVNKEVRMVGSSCYALNGLKRDFDCSIDLITARKVPVTRLVTHRFALADISTAFEAAADKTARSIKVQILGSTQEDGE